MSYASILWRSVANHILQLAIALQLAMMLGDKLQSMSPSRLTTLAVVTGDMVRSVISV